MAGKKQLKEAFKEEKEKEQQEELLSAQEKMTLYNVCQFGLLSGKVGPIETGTQIHIIMNKLNIKPQ